MTWFLVVGFREFKPSSGDEALCRSYASTSADFPRYQYRRSLGDSKKGDKIPRSACRPLANRKGRIFAKHDSHTLSLPEVGAYGGRDQLMSYNDTSFVRLTTKNLDVVVHLASKYQSMDRAMCPPPGQPRPITARPLGLCASVTSAAPHCFDLLQQRPTDQLSKSLAAKEPHATSPALPAPSRPRLASSLHHLTCTPSPCVRDLLLLASSRGASRRRVQLFFSPSALCTITGRPDSTGGVSTTSIISPLIINLQQTSPFARASNDPANQYDAPIEFLRSNRNFPTDIINLPPSLRGPGACCCGWWPQRPVGDNGAPTVTGRPRAAGQCNARPALQVSRAPSDVSCAAAFADVWIRGSEDVRLRAAAQLRELVAVCHRGASCHPYTPLWILD
jgi:hypothetical protein